eukprot:Filipodium_phascolosomae@DN402_c0_g2_i1.p1
MRDQRATQAGQPARPRRQKVVINTTTWERDSHDLFDYEARHVTKNCLDVEESSKIFRSETEVSKVADSHAIPDNSELLVKVFITKEGKCLVAPPDKASSSNARKLWLVVKDLKTTGHTLCEGDIIKLGRFRLRVKQIVKADQEVIPELKFDDSEVPVVIDLVKKGISPEILATIPCRICLLDGQDSLDDPLIAPCACKGSIEWVHLCCLKRWIDGRRGTEGQATGSQFFKQLQCELCKQNFPTSVTLDGRKLVLMTMPETQPPYIVLENTVNRGLHILSMSEKKTLKLGRGHECDVRISDVSISRTHATICYSDERQTFILEDHESKFGTLIGIRKQQSLDQWSGTLSLQVGRTTLQVAYEDVLPKGSPLSKTEDVGSADSSGHHPGLPDRPSQVPPSVNQNSSSSGRGHSSSSLGNCQLLNLWPGAEINPSMPPTLALHAAHAAAAAAAAAAGQQASPVPFPFQFPLMNSSDLQAAAAAVSAMGHYPIPHPPPRSSFGSHSSLSNVIQGPTPLNAYGQLMNPHLQSNIYGGNLLSQGSSPAAMDIAAAAAAALSPSGANSITPCPPEGFRGSIPKSSGISGQPLRETASN